MCVTKRRGTVETSSLVNQARFFLLDPRNTAKSKRKREARTSRRAATRVTHWQRPQPTTLRDHSGGPGMVGWVRVRSPPVLESKLLCVSLLYLLTTLPLALYVSFSDPGRRCPRLLLPSFASPAKPELFEYPPGYGERKHALPVTRALCSSPVAFAGLSVVLDELHRRRAFLFRSHASSLRIVTIGGVSSL